MKINVTNQNNVSVTVEPQPRQTIAINRGLIGPQGLSGYSGFSGQSL
jgi:hypothetical protein